MDTASNVSINIEGDQPHVSIGDVAGHDIIKQEAPAPIVLNLHQLGAPPPDFTGREQELAALLEAASSGGATISGLHGQGGVGKTTLALKLAQQLAPRYPDAQLVVELRGSRDDPLSPADALAHVIRAYHPTAKLPDDEAQLRGLYHSVLHGQRALLLLDDVRDAAQVEPLLPARHVAPALCAAGPVPRGPGRALARRRARATVQNCSSSLPSPVFGGRAGDGGCG